MFARRPDAYVRLNQDSPDVGIRTTDFIAQTSNPSPDKYAALTLLREECTLYHAPSSSVGRRQRSRKRSLLQPNIAGPRLQWYRKGENRTEPKEGIRRFAMQAIDALQTARLWRPALHAELRLP